MMSHVTLLLSPIIIGPFFITTNFDGSNENIYFRVEDCDVRATTEESKASQFYIKHEQGNQFFRVNRYETSESTSTSTGDNIDSSCYVTQFSTNSEWCLPNLHLTAVVNRRGYNSHNRPLQLQHRDTNSQSYSYLAICERKSQLSDSDEVELVDPERWFQDGNETFYIRCSAEQDTTSGKSSYLCVRRKVSWCTRRRQVTYSTGCVPSIKHHNKQGKAMLFKLVRASESGAQGGEIQNRPKIGQRVVIDGEN